MNNKDCVRNHFKNLGYRPKYNQKIKESIVYEFDLFSNATEKLAVYVLDKEDSFSSLVDVAQMIALFDPQLKLCLCVPEDFSLPVYAHIKVLSCNVDLYVLKDNHVQILTKGSNYKIAEKYTIDEIEKTLNNINRICNIKFGFPLFKIRKDLIKKLSSTAKNENEFVYQITTLSSIIESIYTKKILENYVPKSEKEKEAFTKNQSISIIEIILDDKIKNYDKSLIGTLRDLRDLRNAPPVHPSSNFKKVCKKLIKKQQPTSNSDWLELSQIAFNNFKGSLILLRDVLK